jgi:hypothetical protein
MRQLGTPPVGSDDTMSSSGRNCSWSVPCPGPSWLGVSSVTTGERPTDRNDREVLIAGTAPAIHPGMTNPAIRIANISSATPVQAPTGVWYIAGTAPAALMLSQLDGSKVTAAQAKAAASVGPRMAGVKMRTFPTRDAAVEALRAFGWEGC